MNEKIPFHKRLFREEIGVEKITYSDGISKFYVVERIWPLSWEHNLIDYEYNTYEEAMERVNEIKSSCNPKKPKVVSREIIHFEPLHD